MAAGTVAAYNSAGESSVVAGRRFGLWTCSSTVGVVLFCKLVLPYRQWVCGFEEALHDAGQGLCLGFMRLRVCQVCHNRLSPLVTQQPKRLVAST